MLVLGCSSSPQFESSPPPATSEFALDKYYRLGVGDQIQVMVWRNPELSVNIPVRPDGKVSVPLVGDIEAAGLTTVELTTKITTSLKEYLRSPQVTVIVQNPASSEYLRRVRITGAVRTPLSVGYRQGMTVLDLVLQAGGPTEFADSNFSRLYRKVNDETKVYRIYLEDIMEKGDLRTNYALTPADVITIPERNF